jgi:hypothetical protein
MTAETLCGYPGRDEAIVSYLYDDLDAAQRAAFDTHLVLCARCRAEVGQLSDVRQKLSVWEPPTVFSLQSSVFSRESSVGSRESAVGSLRSAAGSRESWWSDVPAWARVAAAVLCLGVGAGVANLDVHYDRQGLSIRTGWLKPPAAQTAAVAPGSAAPASTVRFDATPGADAPWHADLAALERQLRTEFRSADATAPVGVALNRGSQPSLSDAELLKRVRALVDESERKQNRELALRVGEMVRGVNEQRQADLRKIDQSLGLIQSNTGVEVLKQRQLLNYLVRVSSQK